MKRILVCLLAVLLAMTASCASAEAEVRVAEAPGINYIERRGLGFSPDEGMALRDGDILQSCISSRITIDAGSAVFTMDENSELQFMSAAADALSARLLAGEIFVVADGNVELTFADWKLNACDSVLLLDVRTGSQTLSVLRGEVQLSGASEHTAAAGSALSFVEQQVYENVLEPASLNAFALEQAIHAQRELFLDNGAFQKVVDEREEERTRMLQERIEHEQLVLERGGTQEQVLRVANGSETEEISGSKCSITIRCDTILDNMEDLTPGKNVYVPASGCILGTSTIGFAEGETVFEVLKRACSAAGIQLEYSWTPMYGSYYIEGINQLYEFDCGSESGWMYKVNGWFPNYGCSSYTLKDGDSIVWCYTCKGLGADVGGSVY